MKRSPITWMTRTLGTTAAALVAGFAAGCDDGPPAPAPPEPAAAGPAATVDWSQVGTLSEEEGAKFLLGLVRILDTEFPAASGQAELSWDESGAVVDDSGTVAIAWFWSAGATRHETVSRELWKTAVQVVTSALDGQFVTKTMPARVFSDDLGPERNTAWVFTRGSGAEPTLSVRWWTR